MRKLQTGHDAAGGRAASGARGARGLHRRGSQTQIDRAAAARPFAGAPALHRLNRAEYSNAIRDLLALDVDAASLLPPDDSAAGFDNIADVLGISPALDRGLRDRRREDQPAGGWRSRPSGSIASPIAPPATCRRTNISTACRSAPAAA